MKCLCCALSSGAQSYPIFAEAEFKREFLERHAVSVCRADGDARGAQPGCEQPDRVVPGRSELGQPASLHRLRQLSHRYL